MQTCCESCLPKQTMFTLEDVEHVIEHVLGIDLPDALQKIRKLQTFQEGIRQGTKPTEPCWDCKGMLPELLNMNLERWY
mgnify:CR=1 FL=1